MYIIYFVGKVSEKNIYLQTFSVFFMTLEEFTGARSLFEYKAIQLSKFRLLSNKAGLLRNKAGLLPQKRPFPVLPFIYALSALILQNPSFVTDFLRNFVRILSFSLYKGSLGN